MELVDGCDLYRLLRRLSGDGRKLAPGVALYVAREVLRALESVHGARDANGQPLGIIHRDVTPSNLYLSIDGQVKLGDFGIARSASRATMRSAGSAMLKGKFAYLAPEQVAGEPFDQRSDLFSLAVVLAEMLLGKPLFAGSGQLAVLLAIRDCRIDPLREAREQLPRGLFEVLEQALARDPGQRFAAAGGLSEALAPFDTTPAAARIELGALVRWVQSAPSTDQMQAVRESADKIRAAVVARDTESAFDSERSTGRVRAHPLPRAEAVGREAGPLDLRAPGRGDRHRPGRSRRPGRLHGTGAGADRVDRRARALPAGAHGDDDEPRGRRGRAGLRGRRLDAGARDGARPGGRVGGDRACSSPRGRPSRAGRPVREASGEGGRKELYFVNGKLHHVASNNASELLGEYLVRRGVISRDELDFALAVLPRYGGRMGDTLISLGLVASLDIFRAIRDQGRDRLVDLFTWRTGKLTFYADQKSPHVEFPLELELPPLVMAGVESAEPGDTPGPGVEDAARRRRRAGVDGGPPAEAPRRALAPPRRSACSTRPTSRGPSARSSPRSRGTELPRRATPSGRSTCCSLAGLIATQ